MWNDGGNIRDKLHNSRQLSRKGGKVFLFFADLKTAFDNVDRRKLERMLGVLGMSGKLKKAVMEILKETKNRVRCGENTSKEF